MKDSAARWTGRAVVVVLLLIGLGIAYWAWPNGFSDHGLPSLEAEELFWAAVAVAVALLTCGMAIKAWRDI
jgi:hypothetical protein